MRTVTKKEIMDRIADSLKENRTTVKAIVQQFLDRIAAELARGNRCEFRDFGVFEVRIRKARMAQNPRTLQRVQVPLRISVRFKGGRLLKEVIQKGAGPRGGKSDRAAAPSTAPAPPPPS